MEWSVLDWCVGLSFCYSCRSLRYLLSNDCSYDFFPIGLAYAKSVRIENLERGLFWLFSICLGVFLEIMLSNSKLSEKLESALIWLLSFEYKTKNIQNHSYSLCSEIDIKASDKRGRICIWFIFLKIEEIGFSLNWKLSF